VRAAALLERGAPGREETMDGVRREINDWVSRYRRWVVCWPSAGAGDT
jgi:hypothetical protein